MTVSKLLRVELVPLVRVTPEVGVEYGGKTSASFVKQKLAETVDAVRSAGAEIRTNNRCRHQRRQVLSIVWVQRKVFVLFRNKPMTKP